ncbi:hypothetical protein WI89_01045 [Burkholderia ubonensis]|uniref:hypothetical protein n=1 Tax=Burkholderia ubonensis TaxID=101571 RepID=UPI0007548AD5|nr:hypothetical protein [Burkholderia ubonensis]KVD71840.1 hypothetical protein WI89_01045 [Burkholderia ubonensis]
MTTESKKSPAPEQASEAVPQRPRTENPTAEAIFEQASGAGNLISSKFGDGKSRAEALTADQRQALGESLSEYFGKLDSDEGIRAPEGRILRAFDYCDSRNVDDLIDRAIVPALAASPVEQPAAAPADERAECIEWANANGFTKYHESMCAAWEERARRATSAKQAAAALPQSVLDALRFYANGSHFNIDNDHQDFDTVSGEPVNWLYSTRDDDTTMIEDGSIAKAALCGKPLGFEDPESPVEGEVFGARPAAAQAVVAELARMTRMFHAACHDLGLINEALGLDPDDGGAAPILDAIAELKGRATSANETGAEGLDGLAHELWAAAQLTSGEGIEDGVQRIVAFVSRCPAMATAAPADGDREFHIAAVQLVNDMMDAWQSGTPYRSVSSGIHARINALLTAPIPDAAAPSPADELAAFEAWYERTCPISAEALRTGACDESIQESRDEMALGFSAGVAYARAAASPAAEAVEAWINYPVITNGGEFAGYGEPELSFERLGYGYDTSRAVRLIAAAPQPAQADAPADGTYVTASERDQIIKALAASLPRSTEEYRQQICDAIRAAGAPAEAREQPKSLAEVWDSALEQIKTDPALLARLRAAIDSAPADARSGDAIARSKRILALVDDYHEKPTSDNRTSLRKALMAEFETAPPTARVASLTDEQREAIKFAVTWFDQSVLPNTPYSGYSKALHALLNGADHDQ